MDLSHLLDHFKIFSDAPGLLAVAIVLIYLMLAKAADIFIDKILKRLAGLTKFSFDDRLISFVHGPVCWTVVLMGILHGLILVKLKPPWAFPQRDVHLISANTNEIPLDKSLNSGINCLIADNFAGIGSSP